MHRRRPLAVLALLAALTAPRTAAAWVESHQAGDDVRIRVDSAGVAHVEHTIPYRVKRGPLRSFDLSGIEPNAVPDPSATITSEDGRELGAHAAMLSERVMRITVDEPKQLLRGTFTFHVRYTVDLVAAKELARDGALWRLSWTAPIASEGFDGAKAVFELPAAPSEPRVVHADTGNVDEGAMAALQRKGDVDQLDVIRPHVARGEAPAWTLRLDPKAFPDVKSQELRPAPLPKAPPPDHARDAAFGAGLFALAIAFAMLVRHKATAFAAACARLGATARAVVPIPVGQRALVAGGALAAGVALQASARPALGAALVALAMLLACVRAPVVAAAARGPGKWLPLRPDEAFARKGASGHWLDATRTPGKIALAAIALLLAAGAYALSMLDAEAPYLVALDAVVLLPIFFTGCAAQLPADGSGTHASRLRALWKRLRARRDLRVVPWARVPVGQADPDELRLLALPRLAMPGLLGIEIGVAHARMPNAYAAQTELLVRVQDGSAAAAKMASLASFARPVPGRRPDEKVVRLEPRSGGNMSTLALVVRLGRELVDRRVAIAAPVFERRAMRLQASGFRLQPENGSR